MFSAKSCNEIPCYFMHVTAAAKSRNLYLKGSFCCTQEGEGTTGELKLTLNIILNNEFLGLKSFPFNVIHIHAYISYFIFLYGFSSNLLIFTLKDFLLGSPNLKFHYLLVSHHISTFYCRRGIYLTRYTTFQSIQFPPCLIYEFPISTIETGW